jgi:hypothetical protein
MLSLRKPSAERLRDFLAAQAQHDLTYLAVGATAAEPPAGYVVDRTRVKLGEGQRHFAEAKAALGRWQHFRLGWVEEWPPDTPIQAGQVVAVVARLFGLWSLNACRIVYLVVRGIGPHVCRGTRRRDGVRTGGGIMAALVVLLLGTAPGQAKRGETPWVQASKDKTGARTQPVRPPVRAVLGRLELFQTTALPSGN